jgi:hypothetical protein
MGPLVVRQGPLNRREAHLDTIDRRLSTGPHAFEYDARNDFPLLPWTAIGLAHGHGYPRY